MNQKRKGGTTVTSRGVPGLDPRVWEGVNPTIFTAPYTICVMLEDRALAEGLTLHILSSKPEREKEKTERLYIHLFCIPSV